jgi:sigma-B regulation protein RsbU (phosphoserine phosphatase)
MLDDRRFADEHVTLSPGDRILAYTDGVTEATDAQDELFGAAGIQAAASRLIKLPLHLLVEGLLAEVLEFGRGRPQSDDVAILAVAWESGRNLASPSRGATTRASSVEPARVARRAQDEPTASAGAAAACSGRTRPLDWALGSVPAAEQLGPDRVPAAVVGVPVTGA